jgi:chromosome partitioning protein
MTDKRTRIIAVANEKGGVGKTVTVINLGAALARAAQTVLIVDMDPQAGATRGFNVEINEGAPTVYDMLMNKNSCEPARVIRRTQWEGIDIIASHADLSGAEVELVDEEGRENRLKDALFAVNGKYDYIIVDTPPSLSLLTVNVFAYVREVIVPCQTHPYAYAALGELFDTIEAVREEINPDLGIMGILATFFDSRTRVGQHVLTQLQTDEKTKDLLFKTIIRLNTTIAESAYVKKPVVYYRKGSFGAMDYTSFANEVENRGRLSGR